MRKTPRSGTQEAARQFLTGNDFEPPERMIADLTPEQAVVVPSGFPYSIARQVAHMLFWQKRWLGRINDEPLEHKRGKLGDWPDIPPEEWNSVRTAFLNGLQALEAKAQDETERNRTLPNGDTVDEILLMIVLHNTYHLGQIALIRQLLNTWPPQGGEDTW
jgi:uncharacterized damage-inducible protein DinB